MSRSFQSVFSLAAGLVMVSCGGGGGGGGGSTAIDDLGTETAEVVCANLFDCCDPTELMEELGFFDVETEAECVTVLGAFVDGFLGDSLKASVANGRLIFHGDRYRSCLDLAAGLSCLEAAEGMSDDLEELAGCEDPFEGLVAAGAACASDEECISDFCSGDSTDFDGNVTEGVCATAPGNGADCSVDFECASGFFCDLGDGPPTCAPTLANGMPCDFDDECQSNSCPVDTCSSELTCDGV